MKFPSYIELIKLSYGFLLSGPAAIVVSIFLWKRHFKGETIPGRGGKRQSALPAAIVTSLMGILGFVGAYSSVLNAWRFRNLDPARITAIKVQKMIGEGRPDPTPAITVTDARLIRDGLDRLAGASGRSRARSRSNESFADGYMIQLVVDGREARKPLYISVYRKNSRGEPIGAVVPHVGVDSSGSMNKAGEYSSNPFLEWVSQHIDPLFDESRIRLEGSISKLQYPR
jgi:hypothetical protein